jgi:hypothetical protein
MPQLRAVALSIAGLAFAMPQPVAANRLLEGLRQAGSFARRLVPFPGRQRAQRQIQPQRTPATPAWLRHARRWTHNPREAFAEWQPRAGAAVWQRLRTGPVDPVLPLPLDDGLAEKKGRSMLRPGSDGRAQSVAGLLAAGRSLQEVAAAVA